MSSDINKSSLENFSSFFRNYGIALGIIIAAMPIVSRAFELLPIYHSIKNSLTFYTTAGSLLLIAIIFSSRRQIGVAVFPQNRSISKPLMRKKRVFQFGVPLVCILGAVVSMVWYINVMESSLGKAMLTEPRKLTKTLEERAKKAISDGKTGLLATGTYSLDKRFLKNESYSECHKETSSEDKGTSSENKFLVQAFLDTEKNLITGIPKSNDLYICVLKTLPYFKVPLRTQIELSYSLFFMFIVGAFVWMSIIEYMQEILELSDKDLINVPYDNAVDEP